jgi:hypothetical protein
VENSDILHFILVCRKLDIEEKSKLFTGMILKVLTLSMERLGSVVHGVNSGLKSPAAHIKGAPRDISR